MTTGSGPAVIDGFPEVAQKPEVAFKKKDQISLINLKYYLIIRHLLA